MLVDLLFVFKYTGSQRAWTTLKTCRPYAYTAKVIN